MTAISRYDAVADFYAAGWTDDVGDLVSTCLLGMLGPVEGRRVLEVACGHGRITRALARRGAAVTGADISGALIGKAQDSERAQPLGIRYVCADAAGPGFLEGEDFDLVVCSFGLSDIDDLEGVLSNVSRLLRGRFVFSILHPCFPGGRGVSGSWPTAASYYQEGWWQADGALSSLRRKVGANHRTLSTYLNALHRHGLILDETAEPSPPAEWVATRPDAARHPVFLVTSCRRS
jgi:SAM-dependent methyltransferase